MVLPVLDLRPESRAMVLPELDLRSDRESLNLEAFVWVSGERSVSKAITRKTEAEWAVEGIEVIGGNETGPFTGTIVATGNGHGHE